MITFKNDKKFHKYLEDVERLVPELTDVEISILKKCYRKEMTPEESARVIVKYSDDCEEIN